MNYKDQFMETQQHICENSELLKSTQQSVSLTERIEEGFVSGKNPRSETSEVSFEESFTVYSTCNYSVKGFHTAVLNFANPFEPGGGVVSGADGQEESICRVSNLYNCLASRNAAPFYELHKRIRTANGESELFLGSDQVLYSPDIVLFPEKGTGETDTYSNRAWVKVDVISCSAPLFTNRNAILPLGDLEHLFIRRIRNIMEVAIEHEVDVLILGAFGCGAFMNPPQVVAKAFRSVLLEERYRHAFRHVVFAVATNCGGIDLSQEKTVPTWILLQRWTVDVFRKAFAMFPLLADSPGTADMTASLQL